MNREELKANRKSVDRTRRFLTALEGTYKANQPFDVVHHPRAFNKSPWCKSGMHKWITDVLMGIPIMKCKNCGEIAMKGSFNGTETKQEIRSRNVRFREPDKTINEHVEEVFRRINHNDRK